MCCFFQYVYILNVHLKRGTYLNYVIYIFSHIDLIKNEEKNKCHIFEIYI
ncbi:hypothetical protein, partial [Plasmodium yoelii yoelii]